MNIPIYRAKKIDSDEYVDGSHYHYVEEDRHFIVWLEIGVEKNYGCLSVNGELLEEIDPSTLAIHFPDMLDSKGNKIFASLSEDGKGGDILTAYSKAEDRVVKGTLIYSNLEIRLKGVRLKSWNREESKPMIIILPYRERKIIGIQE